MKLRTLSAAALVALATLGLTGCQSKVGEAAVVGGHRISDNDVSGYVSKAGADPSAVAAVKAQNGKVEPRTQALTQLIQEQLFTATLAKHGGVPSDAQLAAIHDKAISAILGSSAGTGRVYDAAVGQRVRALGFTPAFATLVVRTLELEYTLATRLSSPGGLLSAIQKAGISVTVSRRYGRWVPSKLTIDTSGNGGLPGFISIAPSAGVAAGPVTGQ